MASRIDGYLCERLQNLSPQRIDLGDRFNLIAEKFDPDRTILFVRREDLNHIAPNPEGAPVKIDIVPFILNLHQFRKDFLSRYRHPLFQKEEHPVIRLRRPQAIDAGDAGDNDHIISLEEGPRGRVPHLIDLFIDLRILFNIGVGRRDVGFRLIIVVIADEKLNRILRKEFFELAVKLSGQSLVVGDDQRGFLNPLDHIGHGEGLTGAGHAEKSLMGDALENSLAQLFNGLRLISLGLELGDKLELAHAFILQQKGRNGKEGKDGRPA